MSTRAYYKKEEIGANKPGFSKTRSIIETAFYGNNVIPVSTLHEAYELAKKSPGTIITDMPVERGEEFGLPRDAKVLLFNDGSITGRCAAARKITGESGVDCNDLDKKVMDAIYDCRYKKLYHAQAYIGLDQEFMVKAHLLIPEGEENILYSWLLNFQYLSDESVKQYSASKPIGTEPDIYIFSNPQWKHTDHPFGLTYFDAEHNCAALLGMRYFGEHKKGTLTIAWAIANRNGYASCHGGQKEYVLSNGEHHVMSVFGLSGSGKSTITHATHNNRYNITVLHDDAFIINTETCASIALEPTYFDKTADYPTYCEDNKYILTAQNCAVTKDENGDIVLVTEDIRNGNGRAIKSKYWSKNRVNKISDPVNSIFWIMKDPTLPPVIKLKGASLASVMGATLATKRSNAEHLVPGVEQDALVVEPYANPFRTYPLSDDYEKFKKLVAEKNVDCYVINTGDFMGKNVSPSDTLSIIEHIVEKKANFKQWGPFNDIEIYEWEGFIPDLDDPNYKEALKARINDRIHFIQQCHTAKDGFDRLPPDALEALYSIFSKL